MKGLKLVGWKVSDLINNEKWQMFGTVSECLVKKNVTDLMFLKTNDTFIFYVNTAEQTNISLL